MNAGGFLRSFCEGKMHDVGMPMRKSQRYLLAGGLGFVALSLISLALLLVTVLTEGNGKTPIASSVVATKAPTATPTPILHVSPSQGWVNIPSTSDAFNLQFSTGHPLDGYYCSGTFGKNPEIFTLHVTHNGGLTWTALPLPLPEADACTLEVNPANSNDVLVGAVPCYGPCDGDATIPLHWYRSLNGGKTWTPLQLSPADQAARTQVIVVPHWYFAGNYLYEFVSDFTQSGYQIPMPQPLGVSVNGDDFTWMDNAALVAATHIPSANGAFPFPFVWHGSLYFSFRATTGATTIVSTSDGGQTWQSFTPTFQGAAPQGNFGVLATSATTIYIAFSLPGTPPTSV